MKRKNISLYILYTGILLLMLACVVNVLFVTLGKVHLLSGTSLEQYIDNTATVTETLKAERGNIYDCNGTVIAKDEKTYDIICYLSKDRTGPNGSIEYVDDYEYTAKALSSILDITEEEIYGYLTRNPDLYQTELGPNGRNLSEDTKNLILADANLHGIDFRESTKRVYPLGSDFSSYLIGYAQSDEEGTLVGKMGLEEYLNDELSGEDGTHTYQKDKNGYILSGMYEELVEAQDGYDVYLTLDSSIQTALNQCMDDIEESHDAIASWGAVMEIDTGKILAWGQDSNFDPNTLEIENWLNQGSEVAYEPGSVFKAIIYSATIDLGLYDSSDTFNSKAFCYLSDEDGRPYRVNDGEESFGCVYNAQQRNWGTVGLDYGLIYSSNVATSTLLADYITPSQYLQYVDAFGFFKEVDTDGINEVTGTLNYQYPSEKLALTYGQGSSVTMLQLLQAYSAIFSDGTMKKPYYIDKIVDSDTDTIIYEGETTISGTPIKEETALQMQDLLARVVSDKAGTARFYAVDEVTIMAKTGSSEIADETSTYTGEYTTSSVMLAFPVEDPQYIIYFAYTSPTDKNAHYYSEDIKNLIRRVAVYTNTSTKEVSEITKVEKMQMINVLNKDIETAINELEDMKLEVIVIGDGDTVVNQYPNYNDDVYSKQKVFVLTNGSNISLPDFNGWTKKEIISYWLLSGLSITMEGDGQAYEQNILPNEIVNKSSNIIIKLKTKEEQND